MTNTLLTPSIIAKEALIALENETVLAGLVHRAYSKEFQKVGDTVTIRKPTTFTAQEFSSTIIPQTVSEGSVQVVLDKHLDISFEVGAKELSLDVVSFSQQFIAPAMRAHAQKVDELLAARYVDIAGHAAVTSGTAVVGDISQLRAQLNLQKAPMPDRCAVLHPTTEARYLALNSFLNAEKTGDTKALRQGSMGRVMGMDFYMDQNITTHTAGGQGTTAAITVESTVGANTVTVDAVTSTATVAVGDVFKISGDPTGYRITTAQTATVATVALIFSPSLKHVAADNATVTFQATHLASLAFHKNAFALVTAPLAPPIGGALAAVENYKGLSCRAAYGYTMSSKTNVISIDMLCGVKTLDKELAARLCEAI